MDSTSRKGALGESGQTWTVDSSLTSADFRVGLNMSNGDHGGGKMVFYPLQELERGRITFGLLRVENRVFIEIITLCVRRWLVRDSGAGSLLVAAQVSLLTLLYLEW